jgi:hypothetical protein
MLPYVDRSLIHFLVLSHARGRTFYILGTQIMTLVAFCRAQKKIASCIPRVLFFIIISGGGTFGTAATTGLLYQPQTIGVGDCGEIGEMKIGKGNRNTRGKNLPQRHFVHHTSHLTRTGFETGPPPSEASD